MVSITLASAIIWGLIIVASVAFVGGFVAGLLKAIFSEDPRKVAGDRRAKKKGNT